MRLRPAAMPAGEIPAWPPVGSTISPTRQRRPVVLREPGPSGLFCASWGRWIDTVWGTVSNQEVVMQVPSVGKVLNVLALTAVSVLGALFGYRFFRAELAASVYRDRLEAAAVDYQRLATTYNEAVRRTAVTELVVKDNKLSVRIRGLSGVLEEIPTRFDPRGEIYIDYVVIENRLWIRRVFDARTAPGDGLVVDPRFINVEWDSRQARYGKAVYRTLGEGRWVVTVTGDGSLGLEKGDDTRPVALDPAPQIKDYEEVVEKANDAARSIGVADVWRWMVGGNK